MHWGQEVPRRLRRRRAVTQEQRQRRVRAQLGQVVAARPSTNCDGGNPRLRRLITTRASSTAAAPLARNASMTSGTPPCAVTKPVSAR